MIVADRYIRDIQIIYRTVKGRNPSRDPRDIGHRLVKVYEDFVGTTTITSSGEVPHIYVY
jgi:hypothetical protein